MLPRIHPDRIHVAFDDHRLVANVGLILHLDLPQLVDRDLDLGDAPGRANPGDKMMTLVAFALVGGNRAFMHLTPSSATATTALFGGFGLKMAVKTAAYGRPNAAR